LERKTGIGDFWAKHVITYVTHPGEEEMVSRQKALSEYEKREGIEVNLGDVQFIHLEIHMRRGDAP
jgi:hypothetical protein